MQSVSLGLLLAVQVCQQASNYLLSVEITGLDSHLLAKRPDSNTLKLIPT